MISHDGGKAELQRGVHRTQWDDDKGQARDTEHRVEKRLGHLVTYIKILAYS